MVRLTYKLRLRLSRFLIASSSNIFREGGAFYVLIKKRVVLKSLILFSKIRFFRTTLMFYKEKLAPTEKGVNFGP